MLGRAGLGKKGDRFVVAPLVGERSGHHDATLDEDFGGGFTGFEFREGLFNRTEATIRSIAVHHERQVLRVAGDRKIGAKMDLGHAPSLGAVRSEPRQLAHRGHAGHRVRDGSSKSKGLFVTFAVVGLSGARQCGDGLFSHVGRPDERLAHVRGDVTG